MTASSMPVPACHLCGSTAITASAAFPSLRRVTSDCRPWPAGGTLARCDRCFLVQSVLDERWRSEAEQIYRQYSIYHQSGGREQSVFPGAAGNGFSRSGVLLDAVTGAVPLAEAGRLLDIGCGNGSFLRAFSERVPGWRLFGTEFDDKYQAAVESIPGVEAMMTGDFASIDGQYDFVSLIHVLEHLPSPQTILSSVHAKLAPSGLLLIQVPDCAQNPFMLLVADHCSHFSVDGLAEIVRSSGFEVLVATNEWIKKEVTIVARRSALSPRTPRLPAAEAARILDGISWLVRTRAAATASAAHSPFGLFGTAIAATWLHQEIGTAVDFFVDEDPARVGGRHLGRPIIPPADIPAGASVFVALPHPLADGVARRIERPAFRLATPPQ